MQFLDAIYFSKLKYNQFKPFHICAKKPNRKLPFVTIFIIKGLNIWQNEDINLETKKSPNKNNTRNVNKKRQNAINSKRFPR